MSNVTNIQDAPKTKQEKLDDFCRGLANGLSREAAYAEAGYSGINCRANAQKYYRANQEYIQGYIGEHIGSFAPTALNVIKEIVMNTAEKGGIRLKAAQDLLDRAGFGAKQKIELTTKDVRELSTEDLQSEIAKLISENPFLTSLINPTQSVPK